MFWQQVVAGSVLQQGLQVFCSAQSVTVGGSVAACWQQVLQLLCYCVVLQVVA